VAELVKARSGEMQDEMAKARSNEIDRQIEEGAKNLMKRCDVLLVGSWSFIWWNIISWTVFVFALLGLNEPEMFSIVKQMKIIYQDGYSHEERLDFRLFIWKYLLDTSRRIVQDLRDLGLEPATHANKVRFIFSAPHIVIFYRLTVNAF
jgi:guanine nucleotide-binding protein G(i) subunit alpha